MAVCWWSWAQRLRACQSEQQGPVLRMQMIHEWQSIAGDGTEGLPTPMAHYPPAHSPHLLCLQQQQPLYNELSGEYSLLSEGRIHYFNLP